MNQQPDHERIVEILANAQSHIRQSFIQLLQAGATIDSLSAFYDAARSLEHAGNEIGESESSEIETIGEVIEGVVVEALDPIAARIDELSNRVNRFISR